MNHIMRFILVSMTVATNAACVLAADELERGRSDKTDSLVAEAIKLMDDGKYEESRSLLRRARMVSPRSALVEYEYGFSYRLEGAVDSAIKYFKQATQMPGTSPFFIAAYGSLLDEVKDTVEARRVFDAGIAKYPDGYNLFHERGVHHLQQGRIDSAIADFQKAIELSPEYAPSYLRCAEAQFKTGENTFWGMIDGEIFMNLEPDSERSREFAVDLATVYMKNIKIENGKVSVSFCKDASQKEDGGVVLYNKSRFETPYGLNGYEMPIAYAASAEKELTAVALLNIRVRFLGWYDSLRVDSVYGRNVLFDYQRKIREAGHELAYHIWIMERAVPELAKRYTTKFPTEYKAFLAWRKANPLMIDDSTVFLRKKFQ